MLESGFNAADLDQLCKGTAAILSAEKALHIRTTATSLLQELFQKWQPIAAKMTDPAADDSDDNKHLQQCCGKAQANDALFELKFTSSMLRCKCGGPGCTQQKHRFQS